jgi:anti-sigma factor RsiW
MSIMLAAAADAPDQLAAPAVSHLESCLPCQAEFAQYRKILRTMRSLRAELEDPGEYLLDDVLDLLRPPATVHKLRRSDRRKAYIGGLAAGAAAGAAGAIVLATRVAGGRRMAS